MPDADDEEATVRLDHVDDDASRTGARGPAGGRADFGAPPRHAGMIRERLDDAREHGRASAWRTPKAATRSGRMGPIPELGAYCSRMPRGMQPRRTL